MPQLRMKTQVSPRSDTQDIFIEAFVSHGEVMTMTKNAILELVVTKIADELSKEILRLHKKKFIKLVMQNPGLLRTARVELLKRTEELSHKRP
jgi:hypothetical protein